MRVHQARPPSFSAINPATPSTARPPQAPARRNTQISGLFVRRLLRPVLGACLSVNSLSFTPLCQCHLKTHLTHRVFALPFAL